MSTVYKIVEKEGLYYLTFQIVGWVDIFTRKIYRDIALDSFKHYPLEQELLKDQKIICILVQGIMLI